MKTNPKNRLARQLRKIKEDKEEKEGVEETEVEKVFIESIELKVLWSSFNSYGYI